MGRAKTWTFPLITGRELPPICASCEPLLTLIPPSCLCRFCCQLPVYCNWWMSERTAVTSCSPSCTPPTALASAPSPTCTPAASCCSRPTPTQVRAHRGGVCAAHPAPGTAPWGWARPAWSLHISGVRTGREWFVSFCGAASCEMWFGGRGAPWEVKKEEFRR